MATYIFMGLSASAAAAFMIGIAKKLKPAILLSLKTLASLLFVAVGISAYFYSRHASVAQYVSLLLGLIFGMTGDSLLACRELAPRKQDLFILLGIAAFGLGHIMYIVLINFVARMSFVEPIAAIVMAFLIMLITSMLRFDYRKLTVPVTLYCFVILLMLFTAVTAAIRCRFTAPAATLVLAVGAALFVLSDLVLAFLYFSPKKVRGLGAVNLISYYSAQILIAFSLMLF